MYHSGHGAPAEAERIYTLVESGTQHPRQIQGNGTTIEDGNALAKRAKRKIITNKMILSLVDVAKEAEDTEAAQQYWNAFHCQSSITSHNGRLHGNYCKNRFCTLCTANRKADLINRYYPTLSKWSEPHFVTLTVKSCKEDRLKQWVDAMYRGFRFILNRCKKRHQRGKGPKLMGVKSLECNFNPIRKTYNPHFHIIVPSREIAVLLKEEWMKQWTPKDGRWKHLFTSPKAQYIRRVDDLDQALIETIKYGSKIFTEPDLKEKSKLPRNRTIYAKALHNIFQSMKGRRLFDRFGFNLPDGHQAESQSRWVAEYDSWEYSLVDADWTNQETGKPLTGYSLPSELDALLNECIDMETS